MIANIVPTAYHQITIITQIAHFFPDSDYTPNNKTNINKKIPKSYQRQVRKKKYTTKVNDYINNQIHRRLQKIPKHRNKTTTTITKIVEKKENHNSTKKRTAESLNYKEKKEIPK